MAIPCGQASNRTTPQPAMRTRNGSSTRGVTGTQISQGALLMLKSISVSSLVLLASLGIAAAQQKANDPGQQAPANPQGDRRLQVAAGRQGRAGLAPHRYARPTLRSSSTASSWCRARRPTARPSRRSFPSAMRASTRCRSWRTRSGLSDEQNAKGSPQASAQSNVQLSGHQREARRRASGRPRTISEILRRRESRRGAGDGDLCISSAPATRSCWCAPRTWW